MCGARMRVRYQGVAGKLEPYYVCTENAVRRADKSCQSIRGRAIDDAISALLLEQVAPAAIEVALAVEDQIAGASSRRRRNAQPNRPGHATMPNWPDAVTQRRSGQPASLPDTLEADWNERLRQLDLLQQEHERQQQADQKLLGDDARARTRHSPMTPHKCQ